MPPPLPAMIDFGSGVEWMRQDIGGKEAGDIAADGTVSANHFIWHPVSRAVGNAKNQGPELIEAIKSL